MAGIQTAYNSTYAIGIAGMVADSHRNGDIISRIAAAAITPGLFVVRDSDNKCKHPAATGEISTAGTALGVAMYDASKLPGTYAVGDMVPVVHNGRVYVTVEDAVTEGGAVFVRFTAATGKPAGGFRSDADTDKAVALPSAKYATTQATAGGLAVVELNVP